MLHFRSVAAIASAIMMLSAASPASSTVYLGNLSDAGFTANYTIETDGALGRISELNITNYSVKLSYDGGVLNFDRNTPGSYLYIDALLATNESLTVPLDSSGGLVGPNYGTAFNGFFIRTEGIYYSFTDELRHAEGFLETSVFATASSVPEASSWAMMVIGFGLIGAASRRAKQRANCLL
jgi:hypothetical protein